MSAGSVRTSAPQTVEELSTWAENPLFHLTRVFITFLEELFKKAPEGYFRWAEDDTMTELYITDDTPIQSEIVEKRPAIATVRSGAAWAGMGLDQLRDLKIRTGEEIHTDMVSGNMTLNCMSRVAVEAEYLAWLCARHVWILKHILMKMGFHKVGEQIQVLGRSPAGALISGDTEAEVVNVPVIIPWFFQWTEKIQEQDLVTMEHVEANIFARMADVIKAPVGSWNVEQARLERKTGVNPPSIRGRQLQPVVRPGSNSEGVSILVKTK